MHRSQTPAQGGRSFQGPAWPRRACSGPRRAIPRHRSGRCKGRRRLDNRIIILFTIKTLRQVYAITNHLHRHACHVVHPLVKQYRALQAVNHNHCHSRCLIRVATRRCCDHSAEQARCELHRPSSSRSPLPEIHSCDRAFNQSS